MSEKLQKKLAVAREHQQELINDHIFSLRFCDRVVRPVLKGAEIASVSAAGVAIFDLGVLQQSMNVDNTAELAAGVGFFGIQGLRHLINRRLDKEARVLHALENSEAAVFTGIVETAKEPELVEAEILLLATAPESDVEETRLAA